MSENLSRKDFLLKASKAAIGVTAIAGASSLITSATMEAKTPVTTWPWPYATLNLDSLRIRAHHLKLTGYECCSGLFGAFVEALKLQIGAPWTTMPYEVMLFGRGGGAGWGALCGAVNAAAAMISLVVDKANSGPLIWEVYGWAAATALPTAQANQFALDNRYTTGNFNGVALPQSTATSGGCPIVRWQYEVDATLSV